MLAFEQYRVREDLYETHFKSKAMGTFLSKIPPTMTTGLDLTHYEDDSGFLDKPGDMTERGVFYDTRITCAAGKRAEVLKGLEAVAKTVTAEEKGTYTFLVLRSLDTEDGVRIFERYASREKMEEHWKSKALLDFHMKFKENVKVWRGEATSPMEKGGCTDRSVESLLEGLYNLAVGCVRNLPLSSWCLIDFISGSLRLYISTLGKSLRRKIPLDG